MAIPAYKLITIGQSGVGKTSLLNSYIDNKKVIPGITSSSPTVGPDIRVKKAFTGPRNEYPVSLHIWDTAGQEKFESITSSYYRDVLGAIICFSLIDINSINSIRKYIKIIKQKNGDNTRIILVGTFLDKVNKNIDDEVYNIVDEYGIRSYVKVSNITGENINIVFNNLVNDIFYGIEKGVVTIPIPHLPIPIKSHETKSCCST